MKHNKEKGDKFEGEIAELFRLLGYRIRPHIPLCGQEVDILATYQIPGGKNYSVLVECKYKGGKTRVSNADVQSIVGAFQTAKAANKVSSCTIVTTNGFTLEAQRVAKAAGIHLTTKQGLVKGLIDFSSYCDNLESKYIDDFCSDEESWYINPKIRKRHETIDSLDDYADKWLKQSDRKPLGILGGYGTGKTSFCRHYAVRLIKKPGSPIPILIPLRDFRKAMKIESLIRDFLDENCPSSSPRFDVFMRMYREGLLLLLFDGFDEMAIRMDASDVDANLTEIEKLSGIVGNVILTCRPEFFISSKEEKSAWRPLEDHLTERLSTYQQVEIELWSSEQVTHYIKKRICKLKPPSPNPAQYYIDRIQQMSELRDMSVRAVHLDLIVKLLPTIIERKIQITRINLYKTHILRELRRETVTNKRLKVISDEDRLALMQIVAADQFLKSNDELNFDAAQKLIIERLKIPKSEAASVTRDFLNRSFLSRKGDIYEFAHKSLGEFLFAAELYNQVSLGDIEFIKAHFYSSPIAGMFLEHFGGVQAFDDMLNALNVHNLRKKSIGLDDIPKVLLVASCINDYSDEVRSLIRQRESAKELDLSCERIDALVYDIKNKLTTLMGCAQLFMKEVGSDHHKIKSISKKAKAYLQTVLKEWDATLQLFDLLRVVRVERLQLKVDLKQTKVDIIRLLKSAFKNIPTNKLIVNGACRPHWGNPIFLARVFENLAHNVKYAIKNRGILTIDVSESKEKRGIEVLLTNTGPQIPAEIIDKIFNYGFTTRADGQGIGLAIAKDMIKLHNGTIKVRSNSKETVFELFLPRER